MLGSTSKLPEFSFKNAAAAPPASAPPAIAPAELDARFDDEPKLAFPFPSDGKSTKFGTSRLETRPLPEENELAGGSEPKFGELPKFGRVLGRVGKFEPLARLLMLPLRTGLGVGRFPIVDREPAP